MLNHHSDRLTFLLPVSQCSSIPFTPLTSCLLQRWPWPPGGICVLASPDEKLGRFHPHQREKSHDGLPHLWLQRRILFQQSYVMHHQFLKEVFYGLVFKNPLSEVIREFLPRVSHSAKDCLGGVWLSYTLTSVPETCQSSMSALSLEVSRWVDWKSIHRDIGQIPTAHPRRSWRWDCLLVGLALNLKSLVSGKAKSDFIVSIQHSPSHYIGGVFLMLVKKWIGLLVLGVFLPKENQGCR